MLGLQMCASEPNLESNIFRGGEKNVELVPRGSSAGVLSARRGSPLSGAGGGRRAAESFCAAPSSAGSGNPRSPWGSVPAGSSPSVGRTKSSGETLSANAPLPRFFFHPAKAARGAGRHRQNYSSPRRQTSPGASAPRVEPAPAGAAVAGAGWAPQWSRGGRRTDRAAAELPARF